MDDEHMRKARSLILDYISQREKKSDFRIPPFEVRKFGDTDIYVPKKDQIEQSTQEKLEDVKSDTKEEVKESEKSEGLAEIEEEEKERKSEEPANLKEMTEPVSSKEEYVTSSLHELPYSTTRKPTLRELLGRFKIVKNGVETRREILRKMAAGERFTPPIQVRKRFDADRTRRAEEFEKTDAGNVCPSCGRIINDENDLVICTECGNKNCETCGKYELKHLKTDVYYNYEFDFPLCADCYEKNYQVQRAIGKALTCFGSGNYTYAHYYAAEAYRIGSKTKFAKRIKELLEKIETAMHSAKEKDNEWRRDWKLLSRRIGRGREDPRWR